MINIERIFGEGRKEWNKFQSYILASACNPPALLKRDGRCFAKTLSAMAVRTGGRRIPGRRISC